MSSILGAVRPRPASMKPRQVYSYSIRTSYVLTGAQPVDFALTTLDGLVSTGDYMKG